MNLVKIATACAVECERQQVGIQELEWLIHAYGFLVTQRDSGYMVMNETRFQTLAGIIEPVKTRGQWRTKPVTFQNGGSSANHHEIPRLMINLRDAIADFMADPPYERRPGYTVGPENEARDITKQFLWIHPFADGNGRLGFLLYNYLMGTLDEPLALPDFGW